MSSNERRSVDTFTPLPWQRPDHCGYFSSLFPDTRRELVDTLSDRHYGQRQGVIMVSEASRLSSLAQASLDDTVRVSGTIDAPGPFV